jgi:uncharacterized membrane protein
LQLLRSLRIVAIVVAAICGVVAVAAAVVLGPDAIWATLLPCVGLTVLAVLISLQIRRSDSSGR